MINQDWLSSQTIVSFLNPYLFSMMFFSSSSVRQMEWSLYLQRFFHIEEDHGQKQKSYIQTNMHCKRRDRSFRVLALNVWRVSALLSPGSYVGAIEARWLRRCCCHRRKNKKNFTTQDTCAIFNAWVPMHECLIKITYECLRMCDNYNSNSEIIIWWKCWWGWC